MSEQRQQIKRTTASSQMNLGSKQLQSTAFQPNMPNQNISSTGYQRYTTSTSSKIINSNGNIIQETYSSHMPMKPHDYTWQEEDKLVVSPETDFVALKHMRNAMLQLFAQFKSRGNLEFQGEFKSTFQKRLLLLEHQFDGIMRRVLNIHAIKPNGQNRMMNINDFLLHQDHLIADLQKQINELRTSIKPLQSRIRDLDTVNKQLQQELASKTDYIKELSRLLEHNLGFGVNKIESPQAFVASLDTQIHNLKHKGSSLTQGQVQSTIEGWILGLPAGSLLQKKLKMGQARIEQDQSYLNMVKKMEYAQALFKKQMADLRALHPNLTFPWESRILDLLVVSNTKIKEPINGIVQIQKQVKVEVEVGVQDARTKALILSLAKYVQKLLLKYPKLKQDIDVQLQQYITEEMIDYIVDGDIDRIVSITKYVPQIIRVENIYQHDTEKHLKLILHLRVLIKKLLSQMEEMKKKYGLDIVLEQGLFQMLTSESIGLNDMQVQSIIKLFRPLPKIVEVPKFIQKVVDNVVTIPQKYVVRQKTAQIMDIKKTEVVHDQTGVGIRHEYPVQIVKQVPVKAYDHIEKPVIYTQYRQVPVNQVIQKSKAIQVPTKVEVVVEKDRPVQIPGEDRIVIQKQLQIKQVVKNEVRYIQTVQQVIKPVQFVVQKIVQKMVQREKAVAVPVIQQKLVKQTVYEIVKQNNPVLVTKYQKAYQTHQKIVELIRDRDNIVQIPQIVEKLVPVQTVKQLPPKIVQVKEQVMVKEMVPEYVEVPKTEIVIQNQQVPVEVEKYIDRPVFVEVVKVQKEITNVPMITQITKQIHIPVEISKPCIVTQEVPVQVTKTQHHYIKQQIPVIVKEENTVTIPFYQDRIKPEIQTVEKIIEKIVEVPKCVQVQKIVQKIVIVPRIIEKIVEVPQIIQKIVQKIVEVPKELPPIERIIQRPCIVEVPVHVQVQRIVYLTVQKQQIINEQILVKDIQSKTVQVPHQIINERIVIQKQEKPVEMYRDRVEYMHVDDIKVVKTDNVIIHPVEVPVPIILEKDLPIPIVHETVNILPVPHVVEKIVPQIQEKIKIEKVDVVHNIPYIQDEVKIVEREKVIVQTKYEEVKVIEEKIVEMQTLIDQIKEVPVVYEQIVPIVKEVAKVCEFDKDPKIIETPGKVEIIEKVKPYIVNVNKYIERIVQKLVEVPYLIKQTNIQDLVKDRVVPGPERHTRDAQIVQLNVEKEVLREVEKKVINTVHRIDEVLKCATQIIQKQRDPVIITKDKIIEVPHILEKIVQRITVMPQVVQVLKHVVEVIDNDNINVLVDLDVEVQQYKKISINLENEMVGFLQELKKLKSSQPNLHGRIDIIERFLNEFKKYIKHPKLIQKIKQVKQPVREVIKVPHEKTAEEARQGLAKVLLIEQLLEAIRNIGCDNKNIDLQKYLSKQVLMMFEINFNSTIKKVNENLDAQLKKFQASIQNKFSKLKGWGIEHNVMLKAFIDERFQLANVIKRTKESNAQLTKENNQLRQLFDKERPLSKNIIQLLIEFNQLMPKILKVLDRERYKELSQSYMKLFQKFQSLKRVYDQIIVNHNFGRQVQFDADFIEKYKTSSIRELLRQVEILKEKLRNNNGKDSHYEAIIAKLRAEIIRLQELLRIANEGGWEIDRRQVQYQSPKRSENTHVSIRDKKGDQSRYAPGSQSDVQAYGQNFGQYVNSDPTQAGLLQSNGRRQNFQSYNSTVQQPPRDLTGSVATYRSNQVINSVNSAQNIRILNGDNLSIQSNRKITEAGGGNTVTYGSNIRYGSDNNMVTSQYQTNTLGTGGQYQYQTNSGGMGSSGTYGAYGNSVKITTSRITGANEGATSTRMEGSYSPREGVPTTTRKYQFHQKKYET